MSKIKEALAWVLAFLAALPGAITICFSALFEKTEEEKERENK